MSRADEVHRELRRRLLAGEFPLGHRLAEGRTAALLGVSRTPVREALRRLDREQLVVADHGGGYLPRAPELPRMRDLYEVRFALERQSVIRAVNAEADRARLEDLLVKWQHVRSPADAAEFVYCDEAFHLGLAEAGGNAALVELLCVVNDRIRIIRIHDFLVDGRIAQTITEHLSVLDAVLGGDLDLAWARLEAHIAQSASLVEDRAMRALTHMLNAAPPTPSDQEVHA